MKRGGVKGEGSPLVCQRRDQLRLFPKRRVREGGRKRVDREVDEVAESEMGEG